MVAPINGSGSPAQKPSGLNAIILNLLYGPSLYNIFSNMLFILYNSHFTHKNLAILHSILISTL